MTIEAYKHAPLPDGYFRMVNPAHIDAYHAAIARELARESPYVTSWRESGEIAP